MPRYYRYGYQGPAYQAEWGGAALPSTQAGELRSLSGLSDSERKYGAMGLAALAGWWFFLRKRR